MEPDIILEENSNEGMLLSLDTHGSHLLRGLQELRQSQQFTDVVLQVSRISHFKS